MERVYTGTVTSFDKGWGFIDYYDNNGRKKSIFVHWTNIDMDGYKNLNPGQRVDFTIGKGKNGKDHAENVTVVD